MTAAMENLPSQSETDSTADWMSPEYVPGLVSVIIPTHNRAHLIYDALDSVAGQTYRPIEVIVVDDGSTDGTLDVLERWKAQHATAGFEVRVLAQENAGAPAARNRGGRESRGEYIQFLDSDDLMHPEKLRAQVEALRQRAELGYVWSEYVEVVSDEAGCEVAWSPAPSSEQVTDSGALAVPAQMWCGVFRREVCERIGPWREELRRHQDWEYTTRALSFGVTTARVAGALYAVRVHGTGRIDDLNKDAEAALTARLNAERVAERVWREVGGPQEVGHRIARHYFGTMLLASQLGDEAAYREAREKVRELGRRNRVLMGKSWLFDAFRRVGGDAMGRLGHDSAYALMRLVGKGGA